MSGLNLVENSANSSKEDLNSSTIRSARRKTISSKNVFSPTGRLALKEHQPVQIDMSYKNDYKMDYNDGITN